MKKAFGKFQLWAGIIRLAVGGLLARIRPPWLPPKYPRASFANIGEGTHEHGQVTMLPDAATSLTGRYLLWKAGADSANSVAVCGANDVPIGQSDDAADTSNLDIPIAINLFGVRPGTLRVITDGTIVNGNYVTTGANGRATVASTGTAGTFGKALIRTDDLDAATAGAVIEVIHTVAFKYAF